MSAGTTRLDWTLTPFCFFGYEWVYARLLLQVVLEYMRKVRLVACTLHWAEGRTLDWHRPPFTECAVLTLSPSRPQMNRPFAATDVSANLHGSVSKPLAQKALLALAQKDRLIKKDYGKQTIFVIPQVSPRRRLLQARLALTGW